MSDFSSLQLLEISQQNPQKSSKPTKNQGTHTKPTKINKNLPKKVQNQPKSINTNQTPLKYTKPTNQQKKLQKKQQKYRKQTKIHKKTISNQQKLKIKHTQ